MPVKLEHQPLALGDQPALLVVDASVGFTDPDSPLGADFSTEIAVIQQLLELADRLGWSRWFSTVAYDNAQQAATFRRKVPVLNELQQGSRWVEIDSRLAITPADRVFSKHHASCFFGVELDHQLRSSGVDSLVIAGFTTSGCVRATAVDALQHDYPTVVVADAVGDRDQAAHTANLYDLSAKYTEVQTYDRLVQDYV